MRAIFQIFLPCRAPRARAAFRGHHDHPMPDMRRTTMRSFIVLALGGGISLVAASPAAQAAPCLLVTLTGTMSGPVLLNGVAGAGTLVRYGDDGNDCSAVQLQFDTGRGTALRLSQVNVDVGA